NLRTSRGHAARDSDRILRECGAQLSFYISLERRCRAQFGIPGRNNTRAGHVLPGTILIRTGDFLIASGAGFATVHRNLGSRDWEVARAFSSTDRGCPGCRARSSRIIGVITGLPARRFALLHHLCLPATPVDLLCDMRKLAVDIAQD